jgi:hypothetical protein
VLDEKTHALNDGRIWNHDDLRQRVIQSRLKEVLHRRSVGVRAIQTVLPGVTGGALQPRDAVVEQPEEIAGEALTLGARVGRETNIQTTRKRPDYLAVHLGFDDLTEKLIREILYLTWQ